MRVRTMNRWRDHLRMLILAAAGVPAIFGACVTTNQLQDFIRTEIAAVGTQILTEPVNDALGELVGPQVIEEVVPSI